MLVLALDTETTGLDCKVEEITEIGAILYDTDAKKPLLIFSEYIKKVKPIPPMIVELTGITDSDCARYGIVAQDAVSALADLSDYADCMMAHNAPFDKGFIDMMFTTCGREILDKPWVCSKSDIPYPKKFWSKKLEYLGPAHGFLNPWSHRAIFDVLTMLKVSDSYDMEKVFARSNEPKLRIAAAITPPWNDEGKDVARAKEHGFSFNSKTKNWEKDIIHSELKELGEVFKIVILEKP